MRADRPLFEEWDWTDIEEEEGFEGDDDHRPNGCLRDDDPRFENLIRAYEDGLSDIGLDGEQIR